MSSSDSLAEKPLFSLQYPLPKHLVIRSTLETNPFWPFIWRCSTYYLLRFSLFGIALFTISLFLGSPMDKYLVIAHIVFFSVFFAVIERKEWKHKILNQTEDLQIQVEIKEDGVIVRDVLPLPSFIPWIDYSWYEEDTDALRIYHKTGYISFLPFKDVPPEVVVLTKEKIPSRKDFLRVKKL